MKAVTATEFGGVDSLRIESAPKTEPAADEVLVRVRASGGGGHIAVQLARWNDAHVIGTASGPNAEFVNGTGVDEHVNYKEERFEDVVDTVNVVVVDAVGGDALRRSLEVLRPGGYVAKLPCPLTGEETTLFDEHGSDGSYPVVGWKPEQLRTLSRLIDAGIVDRSRRPRVPAGRGEGGTRTEPVTPRQGKIVLEL
ncbi:zinc-binding dehydrogenase (plasmid) [Haladaptatus sp. SPP-AMP-3]|uniref:zinc-binding dehydrogenase n=1 Tax=Haladaptatus sp. SPP-AMP-3 TaxID=3121295 RepID=UPI003C2FAA7B